MIIRAVHEEYQRVARNVRPHIAVAQGVSGHNAVYRAERPDERPSRRRRESTGLENPQSSTMKRTQGGRWSLMLSTVPPPIEKPWSIT